MSGLAPAFIFADFYSDLRAIQASSRDCSPANARESVRDGRRAHCQRSRVPPAFHPLRWEDAADPDAAVKTIRGECRIATLTDSKLPPTTADHAVRARYPCPR